MVDSKYDTSQMSITEAFTSLEMRVAGFNDYVDVTPEAFEGTRKGFEDLVKRVQKEALFSKNETMKDIDTHHLKLLLVPYLEADVLYRMMDDRVERVRQSHVYYLEFLKLMKHYELLEPTQIATMKEFTKRYQDSLKNKEIAEDEQPKDPMALFMSANQDRDTKIANYKLKKLLEDNIKRLSEYQDEEVKREFYISQIKLSIMAALDQIGCTEMELNVLKHRASLSQADHELNDKRSAKQTHSAPLNANFIGPDDVDQIPILFPQMAVEMPTVQEETALCEKHSQEMLRELKYGDPRCGLEKNVERIVVQHDDINNRIDLTSQYQQQVFQPCFELPSMTLEEFADMEVDDALDRQAKQEANEAAKEAEESDDEDVLEEARQKDTRMDDWKDWNPKGKGITQRI